MTLSQIKAVKKITKKSLHASVSKFILDEMDELVKQDKFGSRSDFTSVACSMLLERIHLGCYDENKISNRND